MPVCDLGVSLLEGSIMEGENPVHNPEFAAFGLCSESQVGRDSNFNWVVNFI